MSPRRSFALWLAVCYTGSLLLIAVALLAIGAGQPAQDQAVLWRVLEERAPALSFLAALLLVLAGAVVAWIFKRYVTGVLALAEQTQIVLANPGYRVGPGATPEMAHLAAQINRLSGAQLELQRDFESRAREAGAKLEEERNRLAALMSELSEGVLVCNAEGRILLYNQQARALFMSTVAADATPLVGLGRSVFTLIDREQIAHAIEKLQRQLNPEETTPTTRFVAATAGGRLLKVRAAPFVDSSGMVAGVVLALEDVTGFLDQEARRRALLLALAAGVRAPVANIRAAAENLASFPDMETERRGHFIDIVAGESLSLSHRLDEALRDYADALKASLSLEDTRAIDLLGVAQRRIESAFGVAIEVGSVDPKLWIRADSFALVQALMFLAGRLHADYGIRTLRFSARTAGAHAELDLDWSGAIVGSDALSLWETEPMQIGTERNPLTLREVLERHGGEAWIQKSGPAGSRTTLIRLLMPAGQAVPPLLRASVAGSESRPEYYDFDLFRERDLSLALQERRLSEISYTVFDTETTGLEPSAGDEIISIGAVRIVNGRLLRNEVFEQLVNPRRPLNRESARIHGIGAEALAGQPAIDRVLPEFHRFCEDTVLVAHNAAFDMRFLELKEVSSGVRFAQPVLDTLLLSAAVHPSQDDQRLESIAERLGVRVIGRHTALGDALLTGEIFLKLLPLLAERGIATLGDALEASRQTYYARLQY
jgi:DNA polymerase III subunit epsilon